MTKPVQVLLLDTNDAMGGVVRVHLNLLRAYDRARVDATLAGARASPMRAAWFPLA